MWLFGGLLWNQKCMPSAGLVQTITVKPKPPGKLVSRGWYIILCSPLLMQGAASTGQGTGNHQGSHLFPSLQDVLISPSPHFRGHRKLSWLPW